MRITGGKLKGRRLSALKGMNIRPTSDMVKEAIFNLLGQDLTGMTVLDLFAGTGALGIESLSRGASKAVFVDNSRQSIRLIRKNLELLGLDPSGIVLNRDLKRGMPAESSLIQGGFDLVFLDPPYSKGLALVALKKLAGTDILSPKGIVVTESLKEDELPERSGRLRMFDNRLYGTTKINIYHYEDF
ncbi:MAG: 16S rRNA (guanine(966)-N(2))-methyltransferase RsmD [Deltaproteobacteria bacterium]|nr:16S rRNA (guanine(966)-N(2))-methyltransferase RsmD [Deltaproteobacteria bacterium]